MRDRGTIARTAERLLLLALVLLAWVTLGCAAERPVLSCPGAGGPAWRRLTTPRFVLATDLPPHKAEQVVLDLETSSIALRTALGAPTDEASVRLVVVVFERWEDFAAISGSPDRRSWKRTMTRLSRTWERHTVRSCSIAERSPKR